MGKSPTTPTFLLTEVMTTLPSNGQMCCWGDAIWVQSKPSTTIIIESNNCKSQYKCAAHFPDIQNVADTFNVTIIRVFGIPEHGKGEVDHVGGIAKSTIKREIAAGEFLTGVKEMVELLQSKFSVSVQPIYIIKEVREERFAREKGIITVQSV